MHHFEDKTVFQLYLSAKNDTEPMVNDIQRDAVDLLGIMAQKGNAEAYDALNALADAPMIHPLLREQIRQTARIAPPATK
ncbi:hypothetical protein RJ40_06220 [Methanofollis aquaemaris]|uniref:HEAT repeat domain-containing protein n=1 Tax=Methanofollis aquaemaris TaxID=126734 RepID=A0A8A3S5W7_9EURY|nr:hypothetical protein [Methanofollis aquaemaris]QSZ67121.1 hypothetical protein RJ40_06220 [Methanofollis aquaemaris]